MAVAALGAAGVAALGLGFLWQLGCFSAAVFLLLAYVRPRFARRLDAQGVPTRTQRLAGQLGVITTAVDPVSHRGRVEVAGQDWAARCPTAISAGARVRVTGADGIVLDVEPMGAKDP